MFSLPLAPLFSLLLASLFVVAAVASPSSSPSYGKVSFSTPLKSLSLPTNGTQLKYQIVGVVDETSPTAEVTWFARRFPKPTGGTDASFKLRLIRPDKKAVLRDLLLSKKVDVVVQYVNSGKVDPSTGKFLVRPEYEVKERTIWNGYGTDFRALLKGGSGGGREGREKVSTGRGDRGTSTCGKD